MRVNLDPDAPRFTPLSCFTLLPIVIRLRLIRDVALPLKEPPTYDYIRARMRRIAFNRMHTSPIGWRFLPANPAHDAITTIKSDEPIKGLVIININVNNKIAVYMKKEIY